MRFLLVCSSIVEIIFPLTFSPPSSLDLLFSRSPSSQRNKSRSRFFSRSPRYIKNGKRGKCHRQKEKPDVALSLLVFASAHARPRSFPRTDSPLFYFYFLPCPLPPSPSLSQFTLHKPKPFRPLLYSHTTCHRHFSYLSKLDSQSTQSTFRPFLFAAFRLDARQRCRSVVSPSATARGSTQYSILYQRSSYHYHYHTAFPLPFPRTHLHPLSLCLSFSTTTPPFACWICSLSVP